jgi:hypothetical protein
LSGGGSDGIQACQRQLAVADDRRPAFAQRVTITRKLGSSFILSGYGQDLKRPRLRANSGQFTYSYRVSELSAKRLEFCAAGLAEITQEID